jgi:phosphohistidine phosphatase
MKTVLFIRHAKSSWKEPDLADIERPLNKRGLRDAPFMARLLAGKGIKPDVILSSPAVRAFTTARFFAESLGWPAERIRVERRIYDAYPGDLLQLLQKLPEEAETVLLFGHNPTITAVANYFAEHYIPNVPTCGIAQVAMEVSSWKDVAPRRGKLVAYYYPKQHFD